MSLNHGEKTEVGGIWMSLMFYAGLWSIIFRLSDSNIWLWPVVVIAFMVYSGILAHSFVRK